MAEFTKVPGKDYGDIRIFALSTCGWCQKTKAYLKGHNVAFSYIDVDLVSPEEEDFVREEQLKYNPSGSFPTIVVNSDFCIVGYDESKLNQLIGE